jgi:GDP-L-fucose synthase
LSGALEPTNEAYAMAKLSGIALCKFYRRQHGCCFISALPTNLYGLHDNFDLDTSHVLPALLRKFHEARVQGRAEVTMWGTGTPRREFLFVDDLADALLFLMEHYDHELPINVGTGEDMEIRELAELIRVITGFNGAVRNDLSKPDGTPLKRLDVTRLHELGWRHTTPLEEGIRLVYDWYCRHGAGPQAQ